jgi:hypothetical protein
VPNFIGPPLVFDIRKIKAEDADMGVRSLFNLTSVDDNVTATGNNAQTAYKIRAANTYVSSAPVGTGVLLPQCTGPDPLDGLIIYITNADPNNILLAYPNPNDPNNSINGQATNAPVSLGPNSITPFVTFAATSEAVAGKWIADGIGAGAAGSIETIIAQPLLVASTTNTQAAATQITQAMVPVSVASANNAVALPKATAGLQITVQVTVGNVVGNTPLNVYPVNGGSDTINGAAANTALAITLPQTSPTIFFCFQTGAWLTK